MSRSTWYSDDERSQGGFAVPPVKLWSGTQQLLSLLVIVLILQLTTGIGKWLWLSSDSLQNPLQWYRFVSYALAHSEFDVSHLLFNGLSIFYFGNAVETDLGGRRPFFVFCASSAAFSGLAWLVFQLLGNTPSTLIGASGIAYALTVAFATVDPHRIVMLFGLVPFRAWALALVVMVIALLNFLMGGEGRDGVAHMAHFGGGVFGYLAIRYRGRVDDWIDAVDRKRVAAARDREVELRTEVDRLLDKINRTGIGSLTKAERRTLETASKELQKRK